MTSRRISMAAALAAATFAVAACGGDDGSGSDEEGGIQQVSIGMLPIAPTGALQVGIDEGFFEEEGIELTIDMAQGGAALVPGVMSGDPQFASSNPVSLLTARDADLDVQVISHWSSDLEPPEDGINGVVSAADSGIKSPADLAGRTVAINTLQSMGDLTIREAVRQDGGDPDDVDFVELAFPDMPASLEAGNVDAVWVPEPFLSGLVAGGATLVDYTSQVAVPGMPTQYIFTSGQLIESDPELVESMTAALEKTLAYADEHPDEVKAAATSLTEIPAEALENAGMEAFGTDLRQEQLTRVGELMLAEGWIESEPDLDELLP
jgi:NitT/TauT family transport system substrate-binding protein